ncbi:MAG TPA: protein TolQ [Verrucomicrobiae bacterium]|nr:protein TolQ [Verrucomicrobiae bacterium]
MTVLIAMGQAGAGQLSLGHLVLQASFLVQGIMLMLLVASVVSWAVILGKRRLLSRTRSTAEGFEERFWSGGTLVDLYDKVRREKGDEGLVSIFIAGYEEFTRQQQHKVAPEDALASVQRAMRVAQSREVDRLENGLAFLATVGSTSPYVGLFGTVWGIMTAFIAIGNVKQATIAMVAPGIAEALIATAMGLFAAIPAVIAYNFFTNQVDRLENRFNTFSEELIGILERGLRSGGGR